MCISLSLAFRCGLKSEERVAVQVESRYTVKGRGRGNGRGGIGVEIGPEVTVQ